MKKSPKKNVLKEKSIANFEFEDFSLRGLVSFGKGVRYLNQKSLSDEVRNTQNETSEKKNQNISLSCFIKIHAAWMLK